MKKLDFPQGFLWGSATSAYQVEGNNKNSDWWQWEHSEKRAYELRNQNKNPQEYFSGIACDSYNRFREDFDIAEKLHQNCHRLSIEWARIEPSVGKFEQKEIEHYREVLKDLKMRGIKTFVTLHHFTSPIWFMDLGGFEKRRNVEYFLEYVRKTTKELGDLMDFVCVINEANVYAYDSYVRNNFPPQKNSLVAGFFVHQNLLFAHKKSFEEIKKMNPGIKVGVAHACWPAYFLGLHKIFNSTAEWLAYKYFFSAVKNHADFFGVNYYTHLGGTRFHPEVQASDFGWEFFPEGLLKVLRELKKHQKEIYITENGIADADDSKRFNYIQHHLLAIHQAISEDIAVKGYLYWSLLDNFEWAQGFTKKFGLVEIDRQNKLARKIRLSAFEFAKICELNSMDLRQ